MPRPARVVLPGEPHHVVQRGNRRQTTFFDAADYAAYLEIAAEAFAEAKAEVWAYCLMPNHVHLIVMPETVAGLAKALGTTHQRYTWRINQKQRWTGHLWQGRFGSFPMDETYLLLCARYVGLNPVRAGLASKAVDWPWSSVRAHLTGCSDPLLSPAPLAQLLGHEMSSFFDLDVSDTCRQRFHEALDTGLPLARLKEADANGRGHALGRVPNA
jgi:putative transposase